MTFEYIDSMMEDAVKDHVFPGAVLRVSCKGRCVFEKPYGVMDLSTGERVEKDTVYDLASLTKPLAAAPAVMMLVQMGLIGLETPLSQVLKPFESGEKSQITVAQLLTHTSGLADHKPYYTELNNVLPEKRNPVLKRLLIDEPLIHPIGSKVLYSDIGFMILAWICEELTRKPLSMFVAEEIYQPLGIDDLYYIRTGQARVISRKYASTENCPWRHKILNGEVHDDNAWVMAGDCAHAGLFGTAEAVDDLLQEFFQVFHGRSPNKIFDHAVMTVFLSEWEGTGRTPGFDMPSSENSSSGHFFSKTSVGHLGFTGTSFWMDLEKDVRIILLTNRVHPSRDNLKIRIFRPLIHDAVMRVLKSARYFI